jgi:hypothetical protein
MNNAWQMVTCSKCHRRFRCTPEDDYYNATTNSDGVCEPCLIGDLPLLVMEWPTPPRGRPSAPTA